MYALVTKTTVTETIRLYTLCWFRHVQRMEFLNSVVHELGINKNKRYTKK
jgi:hypothetical protein